MQSLYLLFVVFLLVLITFPFRVGLKITYSPNKNFGTFDLKIYNKHVKVANFEFSKLGVIIHTKKGQTYKQLEFEVNKRRLVYVENLFLQLKDKIKIKYMAFTSTIGMGDAYKTAMLIGGLNQFFYLLFSYLKNDKQTATIIIDSTPSWQDKKFNTALCFNFSVSVYEVIYCLFFTNLKARRVK